MPPLLLAFLVAITIVVLVMRRVYRRRGFVPYFATTPNGLMVNRSGRPFRANTIPWETVAARLQSGNPPWRYGADITREFGMHLDLAASRELIEEMRRRADPARGRLQ